MDDEVVRRTSLTRKWKSWSGELQDLQRLISLVEQLAVQRMPETTIVTSGEQDPEGGNAQKKLVRVTIIDGTDSTNGPPKEVLGELDRRTVDIVQIRTSLPTGDDDLIVSLSKIDRRSEPFARMGVAVDIKSSNPGWARQCLAQISNEIDKSVPKWSFFLTMLGRLVLLALGFAAVTCVALLIEARHIHKAFEGWAIFTVFITLFIASWSWIWGPPLIQWLFPSFELYGEGGSSSGGRRLAALIGSLAAFLLGIIVNLIT